MDQESRWYNMFKRLNQNFMKIRITLTTSEARSQATRHRCTEHLDMSTV